MQPNLHTILISIIPCRQQPLFKIKEWNQKTASLRETFCIMNQSLSQDLLLSRTYTASLSMLLPARVCVSVCACTAEGKLDHRFITQELGCILHRIGLCGRLCMHVNTQPGKWVKKQQMGHIKFLIKEIRHASTCRTATRFEADNNNANKDSDRL